MNPQKNWIAILIPLGAVFLFGWLAERVLAGETVHFDLLVRTAVHGLSSPALTRAMQAFSFAGSTAGLTTLTILAAVLLIRSRRARSALMLAITMAGAVTLETILKHAIHRARPVPFFASTPNSYSFPSGHAVDSLCFYGMLALILSEIMQKTPTRACIWIGALLLAFLIGLSRIYLGVHYPSDVIGGYCAAVFWIGCVRLLDRALAARSSTVV